MVSIQRPEILLVSLAHQSFFDASYSSLIESLRSSFRLRRVDTIDEVIQYLETKSPKLVLVTDEGLALAKSCAALATVASYVHNGGFVIVGLHFACFTETDDFDEFFNIGFGIPWTSGHCHRTTFQFNPSCSLPTGVASNSFPAPYSMKARHVKHAEPDEKIIVPTPLAMIHFINSPPRYVDPTQAAVVGTRIGDGYLVYAGDVNTEKESFEVILRLCGV